MWYITKENYQAYILGSTFFATGGGLPPQQHAVMFRDMLARAQMLPIQACEEFHEDDILVSLYGIGDPSLVDDGFKKSIVAALNQWEQYGCARIAGFIPGEIGAEADAFTAALSLGVPVVDSDLVGGRAAPEVQMDVFSVCGRQVTPALVMDTDGSSLMLSEPISGTEVERRARAFLASHSNNGALIGYAITAGEYRAIGMHGTMSLALAVGTALADNNLQQALRMCGGTVVAQECLRNVKLVSGCGFLRGALTFETCLINVKNEHMALSMNGQRRITAPDLLVVVDKDGRPIHNADIRAHVGSRVSVIAVPAKGYWSEEKNRCLWTSTVAPA